MKGLFCFILLFTSLSAQNYQAKDYTHLKGMPGFTDTLLDIHFKLYQGYVKNANELFLKLQSMRDTSQLNSYEYGALKRRFGWEFDGMRLHEYYFDSLGGDGKVDQDSDLYIAIQKQFGSFDAWKRDFIATGMMRGIGWSVLYLDLRQDLLINVWINEHNVGHLAGGKPILIMDVFEHAYMPQFGLDRAKYIGIFFDNLDWQIVANRYDKN